MKSIDGGGMPLYEQPMEKGRLIVQFQVKFPEDNWLPMNKLSELELLLPKGERISIPDTAEECQMKDLAHESRKNSGRYAEDSDEEEEEDEEDDGKNCGSHHRVQCATQ